MINKGTIVGRKILQPIFERLFRICLRGMNYGLGGLLPTSGEENIIKMVRDHFAQSGKKNLTIMDVGANNGDYTALLLKHFSSDCRIHAFEPSKFSFEKLAKNYSATKNVHLVQRGLGSVPEVRKLFFDLEGSGWASVFERKDTGFNHPLTHSEEIEIMKLDDYCKKENINRIHFLKADVEGFELEVFKGGRSILSNIDFIQFEFSYANYNSKTYMIDFFDMLSDFKIYRVLRDGIQEINYDPRYEILMTTNYLAVNRNITLKS